MENPMRQYRVMARLRGQGLTEVEIGAIMGVGQWMVSRTLALDGLTDGMAAMLDGRRRVAFSAMAEIASYPADVQRAAIGELAKMMDAAAADGKGVYRPDVIRILAKYALDLDRAPFPTASCRPCVKRTGAQADLFGDVAPGSLGRCRDRACFVRCLNAVAARRARWAGKKGLPANSGREEKGQKRGGCDADQNLVEAGDVRRADNADRRKV